MPRLAFGFIVVEDEEETIEEQEAKEGNINHQTELSNLAKEGRLWSLILLRCGLWNTRWKHTAVTLLVGWIIGEKLNAVRCSVICDPYAFFSVWKAIVVSSWDGDGHLYITEQSVYLTSYRARWLENKYFSTEALDFFKTSYQKTQPKLLECRINT